MDTGIKNHSRWTARLDPWCDSITLGRIMAAPMLNDVLPDLLEEMVYLARQAGADPLENQLRALKIESVCDCGDENCASFATAPEVKVANFVELQSMEGQLIIDLNAENQVCFIEVLGRPDVKYLLEEYYDPDRR
ncbi:MAG TPA: hypothetical protein VJX23_01345 [Candidatus Binataceae bacterium]|nr:hypothetical protein [Candidatus Binataceae bacterium]